MDIFLSCLQVIFSLKHILLMFFGAIFGILAGSMPGVSSVIALSIILPFAVRIGGVTSILLMISVFCSAIYGGSITAILLNVPGTANNAATCLDGYAMTVNGEPGRALSISTTGSVIGGLFSSFVLLFTAPLLSKFALKFGTAEYFALGIFGLSIVTSVSSRNVLKGIIGALFGLFLSTIGMDNITGESRFTFGSSFLLGGINFVPVLVGLFAFSQGLIDIEEYNVGAKIERAKFKIKGTFMSRGDFTRCLPIFLYSSVIGTIIGIIPGTGGDIASWVAYNEAKRWSKHPDNFGKGEPEGIAAPEAANNAIVGGALVPTLTLGIPGDAGSAIMLGALMMIGITPGPLLFVEQTDKVYTIIIGLFIANLMIGLLAYSGIRVFAKISDIPKWLMTPIIFLFCIVGAYAINYSFGDIVVMMIAGAVGFILLKLEFSIPPIILGMILGKTIEMNFRRTMVISDGSLAIFVTRPISCVLLVIAVLSLVYPIVFPIIKRRIALRKTMEGAKDS